MKNDDEKKDPLQVIGNAYGPGGRLVRALLPFQWVDGAFRATPQRPFRPKGLIIWGAPAGATVMAYVGCNLEGVAGWGGIPAKWFAMGDNYEQMRAKLDAGVEVPEWMTWDTVGPGIAVRIELRDRDDSARALGPRDGIELVQWGECVAY